MNERVLDTLIARAAPVTDADVASWADELPLQDLAEKIMVTTPIELDPGPGTALIVNSASERAGSGLRRWYRVAALAAVAIVIVGYGAAVRFQGPGSQKVTASDGGLITSEMILADGVVTEAEYHAGAHAVVSCLAAVGIEVQVDFDEPNGHASFTGRGPTSLASEQTRQERVRCFEQHLSGNVGLGWASARGQINLDDLRRQTIATFECVEQRTGLDFGEVTYDSGFLTEAGRQAVRAETRTRATCLGLPAKTSWGWSGPGAREGLLLGRQTDAPLRWSPPSPRAVTPTRRQNGPFGLIRGRRHRDVEYIASDGHRHRPPRGQKPCS